MGIDLSNYARSYGGRAPDFSGIAASLNRVAQAHGEGRAMNISSAWNKIQGRLSNRLSNAAYTDVGQYGTLFSTPIMNAGEALKFATNEAKNKLTKREFTEMEAQGYFNPMQFKQMYDGMIATYTPTIEKRLEQYQADTGKSAREMQRFVNDNPFLKDYLQSYAAEGSPMQSASQTYIPKGVLGGGVESFFDSPVPYVVAAGPAMQAGSEGLRAAARQLGYKGSFATGGAFGPKGRGMAQFGRNIAASANPFALGDKFRRQFLFGKGGKISLTDKGHKALAGHLNKLPSNVFKSWKGGERVDLRSSKQINRLKKNIRNSQKAITSAEKLLSKSKMTASAHSDNFTRAFNKFKNLHRNPSGVTKEMFKNTSKGKELFNAAKKAGEGASKSSKVLSTAKSTLKSNNMKLAKPTIKAATNSLARYARRYGVGKLTSLLMKKVGKRQAVMMAGRLLAGGALATVSGGLATGVSLGMNAWTLYELGKIASDALSETGEKGFEWRRPDKMILGGR